MARKISKRLVASVKAGRKVPVRYRWGETYDGNIEWTDWEDNGVLCYMEKANEEGEEGLNILDDKGWGYAGRAKAMEKIHGRVIFSRFSDRCEQRDFLQIEFV